jgi:pimeloyl-ACP methyl ester carboxylesterase
MSMSFQLTDTFAVSQGLRFHYRRWTPTSPKEDQPALLLLHGLASALQIWDLVAPLLAERGYEVVALDQRGHGQSSQPEAGYDFATIIADDVAIIHQLGLTRYAIIGHSWGASVALEYASTHPAEVSALLLVEGGIGQLSAYPDWTRELAMERLAPPRFTGTPRATFLEYMKQGPLGKQWSPQLEDIFLHIVELRQDDTVAPRLAFENHLQIIGALWDQPTRALYQHVHCPITLVVAEPASSENQTDYQMQRNTDLTTLGQLYPEMTILRMQETIHDIPLQRPQELAEIIMSAVSRDAGSVPEN